MGKKMGIRWDLKKGNWMGIEKESWLVYLLFGKGRWSVNRSEIPSLFFRNCVEGTVRIVQGKKRGGTRTPCPLKLDTIEDSTRHAVYSIQITTFPI